MLSKTSVTEFLSERKWMALSGEQDCFLSPNSNALLRLHLKVDSDDGQIEIFLKTNPDDKKWFPLSTEGLAKAVTALEQVSLSEGAMASSGDSVTSNTAEQGNSKEAKKAINRWEAEGGNAEFPRTSS